MKTISQLKDEIQNGIYDDRLIDIYVESDLLSYQKQRYIHTLDLFEEYFGDGDVRIFSAPGRTEVGGNHTDHQHGEVIAASINKDAIAVTKAIPGGPIRLISDGGALITIDLSSLDPSEKENGTTAALIRGVCAGMKDHGYNIGGFDAYVTSDVLIGAGLSSSAAFETLIGTILSHLYNDGRATSIEIAIIGQYAENVFFGKPCGLMDQMACSVGGLIHIDFADPSDPVVEKVDCDFATFGYPLCITDTKGSHADLTDEYAAVPLEMKKVAAHFGKEVLHEVDEDEFKKSIPDLRKSFGDRAVLRAIHFYEENKRVKKEVSCLDKKDIDGFLKTVRLSGDSSFKYLQNVYTSRDVTSQNVSVALAVSEIVLDGEGAARVHGGGFAGTIQAFVPKKKVDAYKESLDDVFGAGSCSILEIRKYGGIAVTD